MSFPAYEEYKDSGVEWLGEVPEHWETMKLGRVTLDRCDGPFGSGLKSSHYVDDGIRVVRLNNIRHNHFDESDAAFIDPAHYHDGLGGGHDVVAGDLLIAGLGDDNNAVGRACVAPVGIEPAMVKADCFRYRLDQDLVLPSFMSAQLTVGAPTDAGLLSTGTTRSRMPLSVTSSRRVSIPPPAEQTAIASFLDTETSKIDSLVDQQRRLIELLKEKRQAVISHAVTKGLNPDVPMKESGIEWLGEVPEHWTVQRLKHAIVSIEQGWSPQCEIEPVQSEDQWGVLKVGCVNYGRFTSEENKALPPTLDPQPELGIREGDLLISRANTIELVGSAAVAERDYDNLMLCDKLYRLRMDRSRLLPRFLCYFLTCEVAREPIELGATGASPSMKNIAQSVILELWFAAPDIDEQKEIAKAIRARWDAITTLIAQAERAIELLQERRTALISAAVTGKIDVREFAYQETA